MNWWLVVNEPPTESTPPRSLNVGRQTGHGVGCGSSGDDCGGSEIDIRSDAEDTRVDEPRGAVVCVVRLLVVGRIGAGDDQDAGAGLEQVGSLRAGGFEIGVELNRSLAWCSRRRSGFAACRPCADQIVGTGGAEIVGVDKAQIATAFKSGHQVGIVPMEAKTVGDDAVGTVRTDRVVPLLLEPEPKSVLEPKGPLMMLRRWPDRCRGSPRR
jgi:hypothetical protein